MPHTVSRPTAPFATADGRLTVHQIPAAADNLIWLLVCNATGEAAAVDGPCAGVLLEYCAAHGLRLSAILNTHVHHDHVGLNRDLARRGLLDGLRVVGAAATAAAIPGLTEPVADGDQVRVGRARGTVIASEGHVDGHISYLFDDALFCGDSLFTGGCGYLFDGPPAKMHATLARYAALAPRTRVCCAHEYTQDNLRFAASVDGGNPALRARIARVWALRAEGGCAVPSTIAEELATNPFMRSHDEALRRAVAAAMPGAPLDTPTQVFAATRALKDTKRYRQLKDPI